ncbi:MAG: hypothetical protein ACYTEW_24645 [Planctomycetota bacterium]
MKEKKEDHETERLRQWLQNVDRPLGKKEEKKPKERGKKSRQ